jgi:hypothetical protein
MSRQSIARMLGLGFITVGVVHALLSLLIIFVYGAKSSITPDTAREFLPVLGFLGRFAFPLVVTTSLLGIVAGFGLLRSQPWARPIAIVVSLIQLFVIPFGTALGILALWFLLRRAHSS